jgi:2'-5' RNA ligase
VAATGRPSKRRLGVALLLDAPLADEINGLRRAVGDRALGRIDPHITLVPPVNVRGESVAGALEIVRAAARACGRPLALTLGPPGTFAPANPVVHLPVGGDLAPLRRLRDATFAGPLARTLSWPWVPHVTLADDVDPASIDAMLAVLAHFEVATVIDRVVVLEERHYAAGRRWEPLADAALAPGALVGRGGLDLMLVEGRVVDPQAAALIAGAGLALPAWASGAVASLDRSDPSGPSARGSSAPGSSAPGPSAPGPSAPGPSAPGIVVTGLVGGMLVGVALAWRTDAGGRILVVVAAPHRRSGLGRQLLLHTESAVRGAGWDCPVLVAPQPAGFYRACSRWSVTPPA